MNLNNVVDMVEDLMGTEGSREAAKKLVDIVDRHYKCRTVDEIYFSIKNMDEDEFNKYWEKAVDSIEKEKLNQIIETAAAQQHPIRSTITVRTVENGFARKICIRRSD